MHADQTQTLEVKHQSAMATMPRVLVVDDDERLCRLLDKFLSDNQFAVETASNAQNAREMLARHPFDCIVLDIMMPGENGLELTRSLQTQTGTPQNSPPILLLSAKRELDERIEGLEAGAADYLPKPFEPRELVARVRSILRLKQNQPSEAHSQANAQGQSQRQTVTFGDFSFHLGRRELSRNGEPVRLPPVERNMLAELVATIGKPVAREVLAIASNEGIAPEDNALPATARSVDVQMARLRRKIEDNPKFPRHLQTVRGVGYKLAE